MYTISRSELQVTVFHQISAAILLHFISAVIGYFAQGSYLERWQQFSFKKTYQFSSPIWEKHVKKWSFDFQISKFPESQFFLHAGDFILAENIKVIDVIKEIGYRKNKLLIGAIEPTLKSFRMGPPGGETKARPIPRTGSSR